MDSRIIYIDPETQSLRVVVPAPQAQEKGESLPAFLNRIAQQVIPSGTSYEIIDKADLPPTRRWRNAWEYRNGKVHPSLSKATSVREKELEVKKQEKLQEIRDLIEEAEDNNDRARVAQLLAKRKKIRNFKMGNKVFNTLKELEDYDPEELI